MGKNLTDEDMESMSDEDFAKLDAPTPGTMEQDPSGTLEDAIDAGPEEDPDQATGSTAEAEAAPVEKEDHTTPKQAEEPGSEATADPADDDDPSQTLSDEEFEAAEAGRKPKADGKPENDETPEENPNASSESAEKETGKEAATEPDFKADYDRIMGPIKANGREFQARDPDEVIRLMQMGLNYGKKMQALKPNLKLMRMLENNGLLEEGKINFLIDLDKKDPGAIQKLLHDGKIDPMDLDSTAEPSYRPGNHQVSDQEMAFHDALTDALSSQAGKDTVALIENKWDRQSQEVLYREPEVLAIITEQRSNGIYDAISREIDRLQALGHLTNLPFLEAYRQVGDSLHSQGKLPVPGQVQQQLVPQAQEALMAAPAAQMPAQTPTQMAPKPQVLETRIAAPKSPQGNPAAARAAAPARNAQSAKPSFNPFNMSDDEIMALPAPPA